jgi:hypothetical protein
MDPKLGAILIVFTVACLCGTAVAILRGPLGRSLGRMLETPDQNDLPDPTGHPEMQARLAEFDELRARLSEVEERLDFQERLLAQEGRRVLSRAREDA